MLARPSADLLESAQPAIRGRRSPSTSARRPAAPPAVSVDLADLRRNRSLAVRAAQGLVVCGLLGLLGLLAREVAAGARELAAWWILLPAGVLGYLLADLVSGWVHFLADNFGSIKTPILGPVFLKRFREHHIAPEVITTLDFFEVNGANSLLSLPFAGLLCALPIRGGVLTLFVGALGLTFLVGIFLTNQFHRWAHLRQRPWWIRSLQASGLILRAEHHDGHHQPPHRRRYCITSGLLNPLIDRLGLFHRLEGPLRRLLVPWIGEAEVVCRGDATGER